MYVVVSGFLLFYAIHVFVTNARPESTETSDTVFWTHVTSFSIYNALIGYLLFHQEESGLLSLILFTLVMGLHFLVTDAGFPRHHWAVYHDVGRWVLARSIHVGAVVGYAMEVYEAALALLFAFLVESVVFNVIKAEVPEIE